MHYKKHIFICTNLKNTGKKCCEQAAASDMRAYAKQTLQELDMHGPGKFRVSGAGCLGRCGAGPNIVIYPEGVWYTYESKQDIDEIIHSHLLKGIIVERLLNSPVD